MPILYPSSNRFKYARSASDFRARRYAIQNPPPFSPSLLFAAMEQGAWYDPSDLSTLFQDAAGTTPVTAVEQPAGLMLDKSRGLVLGPELVVNGTFDTNVNGWTPNALAIVTWDSGRAAITTNSVIGTATLINSQGMTTEVGKRYLAVVTFDKGTALFNNSRITISNNVDGSAAFFSTTLGVFGSGTLTASFVATATTTYICPRMEALTAGNTWYCDNISVRELPGNHAFQTTATSRPVLKQEFGFYADSFDGVDDSLIASSGGGSTTKFFWCGAIQCKKVGAAQTLFSDTGTNTGYRVRINASNQLELSAGNGTAYTTVATAGTLAIGQRAVLTAWHDGASLKVQIDNGTVATAAFATATAGTAQFTMGKDNNAASSFFGGWLYEKVYLKDDVPSDAEIVSTKQYMAATAGVTL